VRFSVVTFETSREGYQFEDEKEKNPASSNNHSGNESTLTSANPQHRQLTNCTLISQRKLKHKE